MADVENTNTTQEVETKNQDNKETKTYTQEEVDKLLQQEGDRRVTQALKKQQEAQKLASMSQEEKNEYEYNQKLSELEKREQEIAKKELVMETEKQLGEKGLPAEAAAFIVAVDAETTKKNITSFEKMFNRAVEAEINKRIATGSPKTGAGNNQAITAEQFKKMNLMQQAELFKTQPELYKSLTNMK